MNRFESPFQRLVASLYRLVSDRYVVKTKKAMLVRKSHVLHEFVMAHDPDGTNGLLTIQEEEPGQYSLHWFSAPAIEDVAYFRKGTQPTTIARRIVREIRMQRA